MDGNLEVFRSAFSAAPQLRWVQAMSAGVALLAAESTDDSLLRLFSFESTFFRLTVLCTKER